MKENKMSRLGLVPNLELGPRLTYYVFSIQTSLGIEKSLDGAKTKKAELGPNS
jgi:hypothetical protein